MKKGHKVAALAIGSMLLFGSAVADQFYTITLDDLKGHWHDEHGDAVNGPAHSGGLDRFGCHNGSVPYHCHR